MKTYNLLKPLFHSTICFGVIIILFSIVKGINYFPATYYYYEGFVCHNNDENEKAIYYYSKSLAFDSTNFNTYIARGSTYLELEKPKLAIKDYFKAITINSKNERPYAYIGRSYFILKDSLNSLQFLNKAIEINNNFGYAYYNRGLVKYTLFYDFEAGCKDLKTAHILGEKDAITMIKEADCK